MIISTRGVVRDKATFTAHEQRVLAAVVFGSGVVGLAAPLGRKSTS